MNYCFNKIKTMKTIINLNNYKNILESLKKSRFNEIKLQFESVDQEIIEMFKPYFWAAKEIIFKEINNSINPKKIFTEKNTHNNLKIKILDSIIESYEWINAIPPHVKTVIFNENCIFEDYEIEQINLTPKGINSAKYISLNIFNEITKDDFNAIKNSVHRIKTINFYCINFTKEIIDGFKDIKFRKLNEYSHITCSGDINSMIKLFDEKKNN